MILFILINMKMICVKLLCASPHFIKSFFTLFSCAMSISETAPTSSRMYIRIKNLFSFFYLKMNKWIVIRYVVGVVRMIITRVLYARARVWVCIWVWYNIWRLIQKVYRGAKWALMRYDCLLVCWNARTAVASTSLLNANILHSAHAFWHWYVFQLEQFISLMINYERYVY